MQRLYIYMTCTSSCKLQMSRSPFFPTSMASKCKDYTFILRVQVHISCKCQGHHYFTFNTIPVWKFFSHVHVFVWLYVIESREVRSWARTKEAKDAIEVSRSNWLILGFCLWCLMYNRGMCAL